MTKIFFITASLLFLNLFAVGQPKLKDLIKDREKAVFKVLTFDRNNNPLASGSGFFISPNGTAISNVHVFKGAYSVKIKLIDGKEFNVQYIIDFDESFDLIKFKIEGSNSTFPSLTPYNGRIEKGENVFTIGSPLGLESTVSTGIVSNVREFEGYGRVIQITAPISHGSSGGTVFNENGYLIGVTTFGITEGQNLNFAVDIKKILQLKRTLNATILQYATTFNSDLYMLKGLSEMANNEYQKAVDYFTKYINQKPKNDIGYLRRGNAYKELKNAINAMYDYNKCIELNPQNEIAYSNRGLLKGILGDLSGGFQDCISSLKINENSVAYYNLGWICFEQEDYEQAERAFSDAIKLEPSKASIYNERGQARIQLKKYKEAIQDFTSLIGLEPSNPMAFINRAICYLQLSENNEACKDLKKAKELGFNDDKLGSMLENCK
jgi:Flp pilus assembly protein TadD